jgi:branched-chain amino acid transport system ATP-binding protein
LSALLEVRGLSVAYGDATAVWDVSFNVPEGALVSIVGSNGAGKSTTLRAVLGLLPVATGEIVFDGRPLRDVRSYDRIKAGMALVPEGRRVFPLLTVEENLKLGSFPHPRANVKELLEDIYAKFPRLAERRRQHAGSLSGGEQQMLAIGRALMSRPRLLMLDEPSLGLSPLMVGALYDLLRSLHESKMTILLVEQHIHGALSLADYAYVVETGRVTREGRGASLLADPEVRAAYLAL